MAIASCLIDTNILLRLARRSDPQHLTVEAAVSQLAAQGTQLCYTHQNIAELWNVMTRAIDRNGLGLSVGEAESEVRAIEGGMHFLPDEAAVYREWRRLIVLHAITGVHVHDARLAAAMHVHRVSHILTLNTADFSRFTDITTAHPSSIP